MKDEFKISDIASSKEDKAADSALDSEATSNAEYAADKDGDYGE